jgi:hypothetical protein
MSQLFATSHPTVLPSQLESVMLDTDSFLIKETNRVQAGSNEFQTIVQNTSVTLVELCPEDPNLSLIKAIVHPLNNFCVI